MNNYLKPLIGKLASFAKTRMGFSHPPRLFLKNDLKNSKKPLGRTAFYDPNDQSITLFITARHPKDILRSFAHELVHHTQNLRGDLDPEKVGPMGPNYAQDNKHMRKMETQAYLIGNMCFRDFEDGLDYEDKKLYKLAESKFLKENKTMTTKITKEYLKETIEKILAQRMSENRGVTIQLSQAEKQQVSEKGEKHGLASAKIELRKIITKKMKARGAPISGSDLSNKVEKFFDSANASINISTKNFKKTDNTGTVAPALSKESVNVDIEKSELEENEELEEKRGKKKSGLNNPKKADLNKDGKLSKYEKRRGKAIEKAMAAEQVKNFLQEGVIKNSVNFPTIKLSRSSNYRLILIHQDEPGMLGKITNEIAKEKLNISDMINKSRNNIAVTLIDTSEKPSDDLINAIRQIPSLVSARLCN